MLKNNKFIPLLLTSIFIFSACGEGNQDHNNDDQTVEQEADNERTVANANQQRTLDENGSLIEEDDRPPIELDADGEVDLEGDAEVQLLPPEDFQRMKNENQVQVVDVRQPSHFREAHIPGATNKDFTDISFFREIGQMDKDQPVLVYCNDGRLSPEAASLISVEGFPEIYILEGGFDNWKLNELPVE